MYVPGRPFSFNASAVSDMRALLRKGFQLIFNKPLDCLGCEFSGGRCGVNPTINGSFICFCPSSVHNNNCTDEMPMDITDWVKEVGGKRSGLTKGVIAGIFFADSYYQMFC
ncbi:non-specific serine/threonine protein kinase [Ranunculus cassubicifolius]